MNIDVDNGTTESIRDKCMNPSKYHIEDRFGKVLCGWDHKKDGYSISTLRAVQDAGYLYCINGKPQEHL